MSETTNAPEVAFYCATCIEYRFAAVNCEREGCPFPREREEIRLGVVEFHTPKNAALIKDFYMVRDDLTAAAAIVDIWLMDIATILKRHGYEMRVYKLAARAARGEAP